MSISLPHRLWSSARLVLLALLLTLAGPAVHAQEKLPAVLTGNPSTTRLQMDSLLAPIHVLTERKEWEEAINLLDQLARKIKKEYGKTSPSYALICNAYGQMMSDRKMDEEALKWYQEALDIQAATIGSSHTDYAESLIGLGLTHAFMGLNEQALSAFTEARTILEQPGYQHTLLYPSLLVDMADVHVYMSHYADALPLYTSALEITAQLVGRSHAEYGRALHGLAELYRATARFDLAEGLYLEALDISAQTTGSDQEAYALILNDLALLHFDVGQFQKAEPLYLQALDIIGHKVGQENPLYANILTNLGQLYLEIGQFDKAESQFIRSLDIIEKSLGKDDPEYGGSLGNLGRLYLLSGHPDKALSNLTASLANTEMNFGKEHEFYGIALHELGLFYLSTGAYEKARNRFSEASKVMARVLGKEHPMYGNYLSYLADACLALRDDPTAESLYREALGILEPALGKGDPWTIKVLSALANLYAHQSRYRESDDLLSEALPLERERVLQGIHFLSEEELSAYITVSQQGSATLFAQLLHREQAQVGRLPGLSYDQILFQKGFLMQAAYRLRSLSTSTPAAAAISAELKACRQRLALELSRPQPVQLDMDALKKQANTLEQQLARTVAGYDEAIRQVSWQDVQAALAPDAIALEFIHFGVTFPEPSDHLQYAALLLRPGEDQPVFVPLCYEKEFDQLLRSDVNRKADYVNELYAWADRGMVQTDQQVKSLYELIWAHIAELGLEGVNTVYFSSSGVLHRLNLGAIPIDDETILSDRYHLVALGSTRQLAIPPLPVQPASNALLVGGVAFNLAPLLPGEDDGSSMSPGPDGGSDQLSGSRGETWSYLTWTEKEVDRIATTLSSGGIHIRSLSGAEATEASLKTMDAGGTAPHILHLATHGFFFPDPGNTNQGTGQTDGELAFKHSDNPMIRSGLILAGGNYAWTHGRASDPEAEDGILTAYEISQLNLTGTELVVLSACETGLGDIQGNEGVYGLQRAFKMAGARYLIMSLWQVPDRQTMEFMTTFYRNWTGVGNPDQKMDIPAAFRKTQREMRDRFFDPYSWAGFVLVE